MSTWPESSPILVTGGAGFIGSNFVLDWIKNARSPLVNLDKLTYAGNRLNLENCDGDDRHAFVQGDICDRELLDSLLQRHRPRAIVHFAAESHVDRSIHAPLDFINTNVLGTFTLLEAARAYWTSLMADQKEGFRFLHISTDEVYGSLSPEAPAFTEDHPYEPNSPYSASKAGSDHLVRAYHYTYGFPALTTNCSNNYGPFQFPEKLIPLVIYNCVHGKPLPVYGDGLNVRDWLYVGDHCKALRTVLEKGRAGQTYNIGGESERTNIDVVRTICKVMDERQPQGAPHERLITFVKDRPGHDRRYAIDATKIKRQLGFVPSESFESGIRKTVVWYLEHAEWVEAVTSGAYRRWIHVQYSTL